MPSYVTVDDHGYHVARPRSSRPPLGGEPVVSLVPAFSAVVDLRQYHAPGESSAQFDVRQLPPPNLSPTKLADVVMDLESVLNIAESRSSLPVAMRAQIQGLAGEDRNVLHAPMEIPTLTQEQIVEAMALIPNDLWNFACCGCRMGGHSPVTCPYLNEVHRVFFAYRYFRNHFKANPGIERW